MTLSVGASKVLADQLMENGATHASQGEVMNDTKAAYAEATALLMRRSREAHDRRMWAYWPCPHDATATLDGLETCQNCGLSRQVPVTTQESEKT